MANGHRERPWNQNVMTDDVRKNHRTARHRIFSAGGVAGDEMLLPTGRHRDGEQQRIHDLCDQFPHARKLPPNPLAPPAMR